MDFLNLLANVGTNEWIKAFIANNNLLISMMSVGIPCIITIILKIFAVLGPNTKDNKITTMLQGVAAKRIKKNETNS